MFHRLLNPLSMFLLVAVGVVPAVADDKSKADDDYAFQGEYVGRATVNGRVWETVGLQVVALGEGKFDAILHRGGLPGSHWIWNDRVKLTGSRTDDVLKLEDGVHRIEITGGATGKHWASSYENPREGSLWKIHRTSPTLNAAPAYGATILFDPSDPDDIVNRFKKERKPNEAGDIEDGLLVPGVVTEMPVGDFYLHIEFRTPYEPNKKGQGRGNSGVYIQKRYEVQILDSFGLSGEFNECGALYRQRRPDLNMCFPPTSWQTYDIYFNAARFDTSGNKFENARITVLHNGIPVQRDVEITGKTGAGQVEGADKIEIRLQDHSNPVRFRNIWIVPRDEYIVGPVYPAPTGKSGDCGKRWPRSPGSLFGSSGY